ncbi:hypothetical protein [Butyrivibrio sp. WCD3002]|uniref:hypothetical protein n=1 Tax=Butyrivibrio sp. WCD3002 TaxID=1280676 RepID=UPI000427684D|nr:hypothetical protein [Butyrivibrio sp. WCD3002]
MKFLKWLNLIPLVMFVIRDMLGIADINPIWMIVIAAFVIMNVFMAKSMKEYLLSSLLLLISCVAGMVLSTYYYYYYISSDFETPIVGAFIVMVYGIFVLVLAGAGTAVFAIRNRKEAVKNGDI